MKLTVGYQLINDRRLVDLIFWLLSESGLMEKKEKAKAKWYNFK
jgi:hypothetical protein